MGNVVSRCAREITNVLTSCRSPIKTQKKTVVRPEPDLHLTSDTDRCAYDSQYKAQNSTSTSSRELTDCDRFVCDYQHKSQDPLSGNCKKLTDGGTHCEQCLCDRPSQCHQNLQEHLTGTHNTQCDKSGGEVEDRVSKLQERQQHVLKELQQLQHSVHMLAQQRGVTLTPAETLSSTTGSASHSHRSPAQEGLQDLVISADPSCPPLSLLVLLKQLSKQHQVLTSTFVHSSAVDTPQKLRTFLNNSSAAAPRCSYQLAVTIVWKKLTTGPRLMVSPTRQTYIQGEANIARYLARLLHPAYDQGDITMATQVDEVLDLVQQQLVGGSNKERSAVLRTLNARLGKGSCLVGGDLTLADVVAWSALHGANMAGDAPANVKKWLQMCTQCPEFEEAVRFLSS